MKRPANPPTWHYEEALGLTPVAGCDEAGRGPLAGPVVAAAVILPPACELLGLTDSKQLTPLGRDRLFDMVHNLALAVGVGWAEPEEIDQLNILAASLLAMRRAVEALALPAAAVLVDGNQRIPGLLCPQQTLVKGDCLSVSVAAASVVAKVTRDRVMVALDAVYPQYGFAGHKGYPSSSHLLALSAHGPCPAHRRSFGPVRALLDDPPPLPPARSRGTRQLNLFGSADAEC